jgi:hypothetical protein
MKTERRVVGTNLYIMLALTLRMSRELHVASGLSAAVIL